MGKRVLAFVGLAGVWPRQTDFRRPQRECRWPWGRVRTGAVLPRRPRFLPVRRSPLAPAPTCRPTAGPPLAASTLFQEQQKMHDSQKCVCQVSMSFKDVTVSFTRDEWLQLTGTQRTLYQDVMLENYSHLVFVEAPVSQQLIRSLISYLPRRVLRHQTRGDLQVGARRRALATRGRIPRSL
ncbi:zinc finger protein 829-like isoform X3 [Manis pentadactyla]|uniref:zinc finger protein 829-like isoform X3 n=1 Tax=Manis pentadactyla TaxID=143292 RepID=UPI00255CB521|nr:zinc finger protein 829-like isoform X3 [Manis pentadactyla]